ncbi:MAG: hypothetical protein M3071_13480, partial [Actinomycetota bacterium]|nr:hypothetical protein [Actinomycetota bacterium]
MRIDADQHRPTIHVISSLVTEQRQARRAMQLPAAQTSREPQPRRVDQQGRKPFVSQNAPQDDGSRLTNEPYRSNARASQYPDSRP